MSSSHRKSSAPMGRIVLPTWAIVLLLIGYFLYQYWSAGNASEPPPGANITPTQVAAQPPVTSSAPRPSSPTPGAPRSASATPAPSSASQFDFYLLALSWSPDYCATNDNPDPQQCSIGKKLGFVLHGLWPQYERGYPSDCSNVRLPASVKAKFPGLYPSQTLYDHEWEKHGTCSGLTPEEYLGLSKQLKDGVAIPAPYRAPEQPVRVTTAQFKKEFVAANPGLTEQALALNCSGAGRFLQEVYVCFTPAGKPTACSREVHADAAKSCQQADFLVRNVR